MKEVQRDINERRKIMESRSETVDPDQSFAKLLVSDLKQFSEFEKVLLKNEIRNVLFKYQMTKFDIPPPQALPQDGSSLSSGVWSGYSQNNQK